MPRRSHTRSLLAVALAALLSLPATAPAQTRNLSGLEMVSAELPMVLVIPSFRGLHDAIARLNGGLAIDDPTMADFIGTFRTLSGLSRGVDDSGSVVLAVTDISSLFETGDVSLIALLPVSNYEDFLANFGAAAGAEGSVSEVTLPVTGEPLFVRQQGSYALLGDDRATVEGYAPPTGANASTSLGGFGTAYASASDATLVFNMAPLRDTVRTMLAGALGAWDSLAGQAGMGGMTSGIVSLYGQLADSFLRDLDTAVLSFDVGTEGFGVSGSLRFLAGSTWASSFGAAGPGAQYLEGLPSRPWVMASGMNMEGIHVGTLLDQHEAVGDPQVDAWIRIYTQAFETMRGVRAMGSAMYRSDTSPGAEGGLDTVSYYLTSDPAGYVDRLASYYTDINDLELSLGSYPSMDGTVQEMSMTYRTSFDRDVAQVDGATAHRFNLEIDYSDPMLQSMGGGLGGSNPFSNMSGLVGVVGERVVMVTNTEPAQLAAALTSLGTGGGLASDSDLADLRTHAIIDAPSGEIYFRMDGLMTLLMGGVAPGAPTGSGEAQPLAAFVHTDEGTIASRIYLPFSSVVSIVHTFSNLSSTTPM